MAKQLAAQHTRPDKDQSDSLPGISFSTPVWIAPPAPSYEFFDIAKPHFFVINGVPMAFVGEVSK